MLKKLTLSLLPSLFLITVGCNNDKTDDSNGSYERQISDTANVAAIMQGQDIKDTAIVGAILDDKSTITINDIDPDDKTYTTRTKVLYNAGPDGKKLVVVYGLKAEGKGMAVVQKVGEKPIRLKEDKKENDVITYTDGKFKLEKGGNFVFIDGVQYSEIK